jgi:hypothetical protein
MSAPQPGRPTASGSAWTATLRAVGSLAIFVVSFLLFLVAPLLALGVALLGYLALRGRGGHSTAPAAPAATGGSSAGFGSGAA